MTVIQRSALVPHTDRQMFELVNSIEDYPRFLPWCGSSRIDERKENEIIATLDIAWNGMHKSFTTQNILYPFQKIELNLISGPFHKLKGTWSFQALDETASKVSLDLEVEFTGGFMDALFQPIFNNIANSLVAAFCKRAGEIYGKNETHKN